MKKNISINISGIIFHIEEDGYETLKEYLESINRYFSSFDDSHEIIADIESRIAEIFLGKLNDGKQVIQKEDVESLIATMGSIKDFQAVEEEEPVQEDEPYEDSEEKTTEAPAYHKKLYRDKKRKLLGGVLSGVAYYFGMDPLWLRLVFIVLFLGISYIKSIGGSLFIIYIILWIILPESDTLEEEKKYKKMFRDPDDKVLGGVASGMAAYFGLDPIVFRLIFIVSLFFAGTGLILYIILWAIIPEAKTLTDKMEMQGQPVTLSNIESNIRKSLSPKDGEDNPLKKILLLPFRLIAVVFDFISKHLGPIFGFIIEAVRVIVGIILVIVGLSGVVSILIAIGTLVGIISSNNYPDFLPIPSDFIFNQIYLFPSIALTVSLAIPFIYLIILGISITVKKYVLNPKAGWTLLAIWLISLGYIAIKIPSIVNDFREDGKYTEVNRYNPVAKTLAFNYNDIGDDAFNSISFEIEGHPDSSVMIQQIFTARGPDRKSASEAAKNTGYSINIEDSVFTFDSRLTQGSNKQFRMQEMELTLYIPYNQHFVFDEQMKNLIGYKVLRYGYRKKDLDTKIWYFTDEGLKCVGCDPEPNPEAKSDTHTSNNFISETIEGNKKIYNIRDFDRITFEDAFEVYIHQGDAYEVIAIGEDDILEKLEIEKSGKTLRLQLIRNSRKFRHKSKDVQFHITMPELSFIELDGSGRSVIEDLKSDRLHIVQKGASYINANIEVSDLTINLEGTARINLQGEGEKLTAKLTEASTLEAFDYLVEEASVVTHTASTANIHVLEKLTANSQGVSKLQYKGSPSSLNIDTSGSSNISKKD